MQPLGISSLSMYGDDYASTSNGHAERNTSSWAMKPSTSTASLLGGHRGSHAVSRSQSGHQSRLSTHMFVAPSPVMTGAAQSVEDYRQRKVALITGEPSL